MGGAHKELEACVPHRGAMLLLSRIVEIAQEHAVAEVDVPSDGLFAREQGVPAWVGIEYMAQAISAWSGGQVRAGGAVPRMGLLLGTRRYETSCSHFKAGSVLRIEVRHEFTSDAGLGLFDCRILRAGQVVASAKLSVFEAADGTALPSPPMTSSP